MLFSAVALVFDRDRTRINRGVVVAGHGREISAGASEDFETAVDGRGEGSDRGRLRVGWLRLWLLRGGCWIPNGSGLVFGDGASGHFG